MGNVFKEMESDPEDEGSEEKEEVKADSGKKELSVGDVQATDYLKLPDVGDMIEFVVEKIEDNDNVTGTNKETGEQFGIGCKKKDGTYIRRDIVSDKGVLTINSWELFYKIFGAKCDFMNLSKEKGSFKGIKVKITRNYNGSYAMKPIKEIMKLKDMDEKTATDYKQEVAKAMKENKLITVEVS